MPLVGDVNTSLATVALSRGFREKIAVKQLKYEFIIGYNGHDKQLLSISTDTYLLSLQTSSAAVGLTHAPTVMDGKLVGLNDTGIDIFVFPLRYMLRFCAASEDLLANEASASILELKD